ncbi:wiskott-Aldrich syndrome protein homolog 1-like, partial [Scaptodrosophila lebanonensis]|uniref:Wiskott-Aldrich syndrome protein homolog 1-like n=1 Tax=Drosophila lebanonensis TaxID=7225 RepID=A0A6J2UJB5_DROLE
FLIVAIAFLACAYADVSELAAASSGYDYPAPAPVESYIPPALPAPAPEEQYIPPAPPAPAYIPPAPQVAEPEPVIEEIEQPAQDGYRYKTVRRRVFRHRA